MTLAATQPPPFGELLKRYRIAAGLTQETLAERAQMSVRGISDLERGGRRAPFPKTVALLAAALDLTEHEQAWFLAAASRGPVPTPDRRPTIAPLPGIAPPLVGRAHELVMLERHLSGEGAPLLAL